MKIDAFSALAGGAVTSLVLLSAGAIQVRSSAPTGTPTAFDAPLTIAGPIEVAGIPTPQQMVQVVEGQPFVVPEGKLFVLTGLGASSSDGGAELVEVRVDGTPRAFASSSSISSATASIKPVPPGLTVGAGSTIEVFFAAAPVGRALGYIVEV